MTIAPADWHELARTGAWKAGARGVDLEDAAAAALEQFARRVPIDAGEAVNRAERAAIDWLRSWHGDPRTVSGRRRRDTVLEATAPIAYLRAGDRDRRFELLERLDELAHAGLSIVELEAIAARVAGYTGAELDRMRGRDPGATTSALFRARQKLRIRPE